MAFYIALFLGFLLFALVIRKTRHTYFAVAEHSVRLVDELMSDAEEDEKVRLVQAGTGRLVRYLGMMMLVLALAVLAAAIPVVVYGQVTGIDVLTLDYTSLASLAAISIGATVPFLPPFSRKKTSGYSELARLLHRLALNNYNIANRLFKRETRRMAKRNLKTRPDFVVISGLARAGTTSLMNDLSMAGPFVSLSYANMPFLMSPNLWSRFYKPRSGKIRERSHRDGIMIGMDSKEALEEFFFKVKAKDAYVQESGLAEYELSNSDYADYLKYQAIIRKDNERIYLAKNNNFILRYQSVRQFNGDFIMVILYRDPLTHAASLMEKHREYKALQEQDPFVLEYMDWLGHHEFGLNQKQFTFSGSGDLIEGDRDTLDYWLHIWMNYYRVAATLDHPRTLFIDYDEYCRNPGQVVELILRKAGIDTELPDYKPFRNTRSVEQGYSEEVLKAARYIYRQLGGR